MISRKWDFWFKKLNQLLFDGQETNCYIFHGVGLKMATGKVLQPDGVHLSPNGVFNFEA